MQQDTQWLAWMLMLGTATLTALMLAGAVHASGAPALDVSAVSFAIAIVLGATLATAFIAEQFKPPKK